MSILRRFFILVVTHFLLFYALTVFLYQLFFIFFNLFLCLESIDFTEDPMVCCSESIVNPGVSGFFNNESIVVVGIRVILTLNC